MEYNSTIFLILEDKEFNLNIFTMSDFQEIDNSLCELFSNSLLYSPSEDIVLSLFDEIYEQST